MEIKPYLNQSALAALLTSAVGTVGALGTRLVLSLPAPGSSVISAGISAGISTALGNAVLKKTSAADKLKELFPEKPLDFEIVALLGTLFFSSAVLTPVIEKVLFNRSICMLGVVGYPAITAACGTVAHLKFSQVSDG